MTVGGLASRQPLGRLVAWHHQRWLSAAPRDFLTLPSDTCLLQPSRRPPWALPGLLIGLSLMTLVLGGIFPAWSRLFYFVPYTFLGNSLAPLPYDGAVVYLSSHHSIWLVVLVATAATLVIEAWNMEVLARVLARDGTRAFREHQITQFSLRWYRKAPFWSLVATCVLPLVPHYPMRFLAVLAGYPLWKYQLTVILGRGTRYAGLAGFGLAFPIPGPWIVVVSLVILLVGLRSAHRMNRPQPEVAMPPGRETATEEA
jgi:membrane protein YqaA with SNARE-associated domain